MAKVDDLINALDDDSDKEIKADNFSDKSSKTELKEILEEIKTSAKQKKDKRIKENLEKVINRQTMKTLLVYTFILFLLCALATVSYYWYKDKNPDFSLKELFFADSKNVFTSSTSAGKTAETTLQKEKIISNRPPKNKGFYIQVALCKTSDCVGSFSNIIKNRNLEFEKLDSKGQSSGLPEVISENLMTLGEAEKVAKHINLVNERGGYASVTPDPRGTQYRVSMGIFPDKALAEDIKRYYQTLLAAQQIRFVSRNSVTYSSGITRIVVGPYSKRNEAMLILKDLKRDRLFADAFIIVQ